MLYGGYTNDAVNGTGLFTPENYLGDLWMLDVDTETWEQIAFDEDSGPGRRSATVRRSLEELLEPPSMNGVKRGRSRVSSGHLMTSTSRSSPVAARTTRPSRASSSSP
ncbi:kelch repeat-containing protein [Sorangium cellulosum]|uniref:kelch repeat-containing protein n=1 Tax=Sorangium cellulosum TaxID=56 RepID=UPI00041AF75A|nr:kelch repeat-containing protein [Sorangium cellulosum]